MDTTRVDAHAMCLYICFLCFAWEEYIHIRVGSMLARSTFQGMQEPPFVGRARVLFPHLFMP